MLIIYLIVIWIKIGKNCLINKQMEYLFSVRILYEFVNFSICFKYLLQEHIKTFAVLLIR